MQVRDFGGRTNRQGERDARRGGRPTGVSKWSHHTAHLHTCTLAHTMPEGHCRPDHSFSSEKRQSGSQPVSVFYPCELYGRIEPSLFLPFCIRPLVFFPSGLHTCFPYTLPIPALPELCLWSTATGWTSLQEERRSLHVHRDFTWPYWNSFWDRYRSRNCFLLRVDMSSMTS
jgi:hypothetical protein